jgi:hypothetical protein
MGPRLVLLGLGVVAWAFGAGLVVAALARARGEQRVLRARIETLEAEVRELQGRVPPSPQKRMLDDPNLGIYDLAEPTRENP